MFKSLARPIAMMGAALVLSASAGAAALGPHAADCRQGSDRPAMLVAVIGLKSRGGVLRVQSYDDPQSFFEKGRYLERVEVRPPASGPVEICLPVPRGGTYAVSVRHNVDGTGKTNLSDGGGTSGNPNVSMMDVLFKRRPSPAQVAVEVRGLTRVPVVLNYVQGGTVKPLASVSR